MNNLELPIVKEYLLLDYRVSIAINLDNEFLYTLTIYNDISDKRLFSARYSNVSLLCHMLHRKMLKHPYHALNPLLTLDAVEEVRDSLELLEYVQGNFQWRIDL